MRDADVPAFLETFQRLRTVFRLKGDEDEIRTIGSLYFKTLRPYPFPSVVAGADAYVAKGKYFPKPSEWIDAIPRQGPGGESLPALTSDEAHAYARAERLGYEDEPCSCPACRAADVHWKPIRFVPEVTPDGLDRKVRDLVHDRRVTAGHWAHGEELKRWYLAKTAFYERCEALGIRAGAILKPKERRLAFRARLAAIFPEKPTPTEVGHG